MIVLDASAVLEVLGSGIVGERIRQDLSQEATSFAAPHVLDLEVISAFRKLHRKLHRTKHPSNYRSEQWLDDFAALPIARYPHTQLVRRIWELRHNFTPSDASYIALAELTDSVLYTCDSKLSAGHGARVKVFRAPVS